MTTRILAFAVSTLAAFTALAAGESSDLAKHGNDLPQTVIVRVKKDTGEASVLESSQKLTQESSSVEAIHKLGAQFKPVSGGPAGPSEMDRAGSTSSWFAWYNPGCYYVPTYYYGGYSYAYTTYYTYTYYGYAYYWYGRGW